MGELKQKLAPHKVTLHCPQCGSEALTWEAQAEFSATLQRFIISSLYEGTCGDCATEFRLAEERKANG